MDVHDLSRFLAAAPGMKCVYHESGVSIPVVIEKAAVEPRPGYDEPPLVLTLKMANGKTFVAATVVDGAHVAQGADGWWNVVPVAQVPWYIMEVRG